MEAVVISDGQPVSVGLSAYTEVPQAKWVSRAVESVPAGGYFGISVTHG